MIIMATTVTIPMKILMTPMKIPMTSMLMIMIFKSWTLIFFASFSRFSRIICKQQYGMWAICNLYQHREETDWVNMINVVAYFELSLSSLMFSSIPWGGRVSRLWRILRERFQEHCQTPSPGGAYFHYNSPGGVFIEHCSIIFRLLHLFIFFHTSICLLFSLSLGTNTAKHTQVWRICKSRKYSTRKKVHFTWMCPICKLATWGDQGTALCSSEYWNSASYEGYSNDGVVMDLVWLWPPITILYDETHIVVELNSPVLLLGMIENFTPGLKSVICKTIVETCFMK